MDDKQPTSPRSDIRVYGYGVAYRKPEDEHWLIDLDDEYSNLPHHYEFPEMANDRVEYLRKFGYLARVVAVLASDDDTIDEFLEAKIDE